jgi:hypothetical protein
MIFVEKFWAKACDPYRKGCCDEPKAIPVAAYVTAKLAPERIERATHEISYLA